MNQPGTLTDEASTSHDVVIESPWYLCGSCRPGDPIESFHVNRQPFRMGRRTDVDLRLKSARVSSLHAELIHVGEDLLLRDLGSTNGSCVNGLKLTGPTPLRHGDLVQLADIEFRVESRYDSSETDAGLDIMQTKLEVDTLEPDWIFTRFEKLFAADGICPNYQPIVSMSDFRPIGFEALARSRVSGLENPGQMFEVAEQVQREIELSITCRRRGIEHAVRLPVGQRIFLNTHPAESLRRDVMPSLDRMRAFLPDHRLVLEIHEGAFEDPSLMQDFSAMLHERGIELAYDDFGSGRSRLRELIEAPPDFMKFDRSMIQQIHNAPQQQLNMLHSLVDMMRETKIKTIVEGIELPEQAKLCQEIGFEYAQGFFFGKPATAEKNRKRYA